MQVVQMDVSPEYQKEVTHRALIVTQPTHGEVWLSTQNANKRWYSRHWEWDKGMGRMARYPYLLSLSVTSQPQQSVMTQSIYWVS